jgi:hypothetical protein
MLHITPHKKQNIWLFSRMIFLVTFAMTLLVFHCHGRIPDHSTPVCHVWRKMNCHDSKETKNPARRTMDDHVPGRKRVESGGQGVFRVFQKGMPDTQ